MEVELLDVNAEKEEKQLKDINDSMEETLREIAQEQDDEEERPKDVLWLTDVDFKE